MARPLLAIGSGSIWFLSVLNPSTTTTGGIFSKQPGAGSSPLIAANPEQPHPATLPFSRRSLRLGMVCCQSMALQHTKAASYWRFLSF